MIFKLSDNQPIDTMKADIVLGCQFTEQTLFDLQEASFDLTITDVRPFIISSDDREYDPLMMVSSQTSM